MEQPSWNKLKSQFQKLRKAKSGDQLQADMCLINGSLQWMLSGSPETICDDFIMLAQSAAQKAGCGTNWEDWLNLLKKNTDSFHLSFWDSFYHKSLLLPKAERETILRRRHAKIEYQKTEGKSKKERAEAVRLHMKSIKISSDDPPEEPEQGYIPHVCQKSAIYCAGMLRDCVSQPKRGSHGIIDREAAFIGLRKPKNPLPDSYFRGLTELQEVCLKLKFDHGLSPEQIGRRLNNRRKSTIQGILKTAEKNIEKKRASQLKERNRST